MGDEFVTSTPTQEPRSDKLRAPAPTEWHCHRSAVLGEGGCCTLSVEFASRSSGSGQVNPDASHSVVGRDNADCAAHAQTAHAGSIGNVGLLAPAPRRPRAMPSAINLPAITVTANQCLRTTQRTHKDPSRRFHRRPTSRQSDIDRDTCFVEYSPRTRAQHGVGHDIGVNLAVWAGVVPALLGSGLFTSSRRALSGAPADSVPSAQPTPKVFTYPPRQCVAPLAARFTRICTAIHIAVGALRRGHGYPHRVPRAGSLWATWRAGYNPPLGGTPGGDVRCWFGGKLRVPILFLRVTK
jgi:hypothetical protein